MFCERCILTYHNQCTFNKIPSFEIITDIVNEQEIILNNMINDVDYYKISKIYPDINEEVIHLKTSKNLTKS